MGGGGSDGDGVKDDCGKEPVVDIVTTALDDGCVVIIILALVDGVGSEIITGCVIAVREGVVEDAVLVGSKIEDCGSICCLWRCKVDDRGCDMMETGAKAASE